jgi:hypothetical protein
MPKPATADAYEDDPLAELRDRLLQSIALRNSEQTNLDQLQAARGRAQEERWRASSAERDAQTALQKAKAEEPAALARAYATGDQGEAAELERAQTAVDRIRADLRRT